MAQIINLNKIRLDDFAKELSSISSDLRKLSTLFKNAPEFATDKLFTVKSNLDNVHEQVQDFALQN